ncbi:organelle RRM domain-containing protein 1, chloroplastic [Euphorbia lathyris]|uniref:organelle RRM domain-containing protein 1, chloroplastic n=1 Tax=Euphorbia lathyris TaxID=212925 RepID=UPI003313C460
METLFPSYSSTTTTFISNKFSIHSSISTIKIHNSFGNKKNKQLFLFSAQSAVFSCISLSSSRINATDTLPFTSTSFSSNEAGNRHWMVLMENPPPGLNSKPEIVDFYVDTLERVLGSKKDAQMSIYDASCDTHFGFCCEIDEETSRKLISLPGVLSVRPDPHHNSEEKDYSSSVNLGNQSYPQTGNTLLFHMGNTKHWLVQMDKPGVGVVTKAQMVDYYAGILSKVLGNEKDAQMCIYHVSWQSNFGFCCELDEECARELAGVPGVLSVQLDKNFESENKAYGGNNIANSADRSYSSEVGQVTPIKTKKLFVTGLSFYTSEKTLRAAFEGFGELVEVKIIMDKISKRSKGYAFIEYTTEEAASAALKEMNQKIINGWMIVVDVAKTSPPKYSRGGMPPRREI